MRPSPQVVLFAAQALYWSCAIIGITVMSLVGGALAPDPSLATLPVAVLVAGSLLSVHPLSLYMQRHGRRVGFLIGTGAGILGSLFCAGAILWELFPLLCLGGGLIGAYQASAMFYRFAAVDSAPPERVGRAAAMVLAGGVVAALVGPTIAVWSRDLLPVPFLGAFLATGVLSLLASAVLLAAPEGRVMEASAGGWTMVRSLLSRPRLRAALLITASGHGLMVLVMTVTPLAMAFCSFGLADSAEVIQWHVLGMFLPGFFSGRLVDRFGAGKVALVGGAVLLVSATIALSGTAWLNFMVSSMLLGAGWNLMMVSGTTLLGRAHAPEERGNAQGLMELANGLVAAVGSFASGALLATAGWSVINMGVMPVLVLVALAAWFQFSGAVRADRAEAVTETGGEQ